MKIAIVGCGVVGGAVADGLERLGHEIFRHDLKFNTSINDLVVFEPEIVFVCVPTNQKYDGSCDISVVNSVCKELYDFHYCGIVAIKSTIEPGTTEKLTNKYTNYCRESWYRGLKLAFVPEFLRERSAFHDFTEGHDVCVIGSKDKGAFEKIKEAHGKWPENFIQLTPTEAEFVKYYSNVFNALRVTFANAFYELTQKFPDADYTKIKNAVTARPTITDMYLDCNENLRGFCGVCLPKDSAALAHLAERLGVEGKIFRTIVEDNKLYRPTAPEGMRIE